MASKTGLSEEANKGCRFSVYFVQCKRKLGTREGLSCQDCSPVLIQHPPPPPRVFLPPSLSVSIPTRTETSKRTVPWCASNKSSLLNFIHLCLNNTRATNQKMLDTESEVMRHRSLRLLQKSPCVRGGDGWLLL